MMCLIWTLEFVHLNCVNGKVKEIKESERARSWCYCTLLEVTCNQMLLINGRTHPRDISEGKHS